MSRQTAALVAAVALLVGCGIGYFAGREHVKSEITQSVERAAGIPGLANEVERVRQEARERAAAKQQ